MREVLTDTHLHLWDLAGGGYGWLGGAPEPLRHDARWEAAAPQLTAVGVERVVLVQADDTRADTLAMQESASRIEAIARGGASTGSVQRVDVVAWLPLTEPREIARLLEDSMAMAHVVGVRHLVHDEADPGFLDRAEVRESLRLLAAHGLPLDVPDAFPRHLDQAARVAAEVEGLVVVLDHLGKPPLGDSSGMREWERSLRSFAEQPGTIAKVSGLSTSGRGVTAPDELATALDIAVDVFGPKRLMYGSDWPIAPTPFDLASGTGLLLDLVAELPSAARAEILHGTAQRVYRRIGS